MDDIRTLIDYQNDDNTIVFLAEIAWIEHNSVMIKPGRTRLTSWVLSPQDCKIFVEKGQVVIAMPKETFLIFSELDLTVTAPQGSA